MNRFLTLIAILLLAGCKYSDNKTTIDMNNDNPHQEVAGRVNFGQNHALVTTPQPCVMIATWVCYRALGEVVGQAWGAGKSFTE